MSRVHTAVTADLARYIREVTLREPEALRRLREETERLPEASLQSAPEQGQLLHLLALAVGARRALEVGVFMGYSSAWVALALPPGGRLIACDCNETYARRARQTWREAGVEDRVELRLAPAIDTLDGLLAAGEAGTFDFAYIDADKGNYSNYFDRALELVRPGGLIAADNVLWHGEVAGPASAGGDDDAEAIRAFNRKLHGDLRVLGSIVPLGDGLMLAYKR